MSPLKKPSEYVNICKYEQAQNQYHHHASSDCPIQRYTLLDCKLTNWLHTDFGNSFLETL